MEQTLEMADADLLLMEAGTFSKKLTQRIRALLNAAPADANVREIARHARLVERVRAIEQSEEAPRVDRNSTPAGQQGFVHASASAESPCLLGR